MKKIILLWLCIAISFGCAKDSDFDLINEIGISPNINVPLVKARLSLGDLLVGDSTITVDPDNALRIYFQQDSIFTFSAGDLIQIPDQDPFQLGLNDQQNLLQVGTSLGTLAGAELSSATFSSGTFKVLLSTANTFANDIDVRLAIVNAQTGGMVFENDFTLPAGNSSELDSINFTDLIIDLSNNGQSFNYLEIKAEVLNPQDLPPNDPILIDLNFQDLVIDNAQGYFGNRVVNVPNGAFDFDIDGISEFVGGFKLTNPQIKLIARSNTGIPIRLNTNFQGINKENNIEPLGAPPINIQSGNQPGDQVVSEISLDRNNSNIVEFLANLPSQILYSGNAVVNADGRPSTNNYITSDAQVVMDLELDLPLELQAQNMTLDQTVKASLSADGNEELLETFTLHYKSENRLPFDMNLAVTFMDTLSGDSLAGFNIDLLQSAPTDANGKVTGPSTIIGKHVFSESAIAGVMNSNKIRFRAKVNTANNGQNVAKLYTDNSLIIWLATESKINYRP